MDPLVVDPSEGSVAEESAARAPVWVGWVGPDREDHVEGLGDRVARSSLDDRVDVVLRVADDRPPARGGEEVVGVLSRGRVDLAESSVHDGRSGGERDVRGQPDRDRVEAVDPPVLRRPRSWVELEPDVRELAVRDRPGERRGDEDVPERDGARWRVRGHWRSPGHAVGGGQREVGGARLVDERRRDDPRRKREDVPDRRVGVGRDRRPVDHVHPGVAGVRGGDRDVLNRVVVAELVLGRVDAGGAVEEGHVARGDVDREPDAARGVEAA